MSLAMFWVAEPPRSTSATCINEMARGPRCKRCGEPIRDDSCPACEALDALVRAAKQYADDAAKAADAWDSEEGGL